MKYKLYKGVPLSVAKLPEEESVYPHPEAGLNILAHQLNKSNLNDGQILFGNVTVSGLKKALHSASTYIDYSMFELGEIAEE